jgi:hypothetical protein
MSALYRNGLIEKIAGGRDKLWKLSNKVTKNKEKYKKEIAKVKAYWK